MVLRVLVVGGGVAGIATAVQLVAQGAQVTLLEKRPFLGGRAFSISNANGHEQDNGQHIVLGACIEYLRLLTRLGVRDKIVLHKSMDVPVIANGRQARLRAVWPNRLGNLLGLLGYSHLSLLARLRVTRALLAMTFTPSYQSRHNSLDRITLHEWLRRKGQSDEDFARFWNFITLAALNDLPQNVSAAMGLMLFKTALLGDGRAAAIGYPIVGLTSLVTPSVTQFLQRNGGEVLLGKSVNRVEFNDRLATLHLANGEAIEADAVVLAVPANRVLPLLPASVARHAFFAPIKQIEFAPILSVHMWLNRPIMKWPFAATLNSHAQWIFNASAIRASNSAYQDYRDRGQYLVISVSGAWDWMHTRKDQIASFFTQELLQIFPTKPSVTVTKVAVIKTPEATFLVGPGSSTTRLPQATPVKRLFLAGDWTDTGWPSTMESAARSGVQCANAIHVAIR